MSRSSFVPGFGSCAPKLVERTMGSLKSIQQLTVWLYENSDRLSDLVTSYDDLVCSFNGLSEKHDTYDMEHAARLKKAMQGYRLPLLRHALNGDTPLAKMQRDVALQAVAKDMQHDLGATGRVSALPPETTVVAGLFRVHDKIVSNRYHARPDMVRAGLIDVLRDPVLDRTPLYGHVLSSDRLNWSIPLVQTEYGDGA